MSDWVVPCSDDELLQDVQEFLTSEVIVDLCKKIDSGEDLKFNAKIYPRRDVEPQIAKEITPVQPIEVPKTPEKLVPEANTEFDFNSQVDEDVKRFTPRRTPSRPQVKKVAKIENVFSDIMKYQRLESEQNKETPPETE